MSSNIKPRAPPRKRRPSRSSAPSACACARSPASASSRSASPPSGPGWSAARRGCRSRRAGSTSAKPRSCAAMPIRSRCGSPVTIPPCTASLLPGGQQARAVFEAVEQARVEAIGARRMGGVAKNLSAMLDDSFHRGKFDEITGSRRRADRGSARHAGARAADRRGAAAGGTQARRLWRQLHRGRAGRNLDRLERVLNDQRSSATSCTISSISSTWARSASSERRGRQRRRRGGKPAGRIGRGRRSSDAAETRRMSLEQAEACDRGNARQRRGSGRCAGRRDGRRRRDGRLRKPPPSRGGRASGATSRAVRITARSP